MPIMNEMARDEGSTIISRTSPHIPKGDPITANQYTTYHFVVDGQPNVDGWADFGIGIAGE